MCFTKKRGENKGGPKISESQRRGGELAKGRSGRVKQVEEDWEEQKSRCQKVKVGWE